MTEYGVILFHTTSAVMMAEKALLKANLSIKLIPTPRQFSSDCGISIRFAWSDVEKIKQLLAEEKVESGAIHPVDPKGA
jgi:hypothetical protein